ncbi:MAG TPA: universal stress protein [Flavisolibacter sp.]|jgi:nucleotide-binding universal stress UspA family protein|nr:universal stress protein [Flavisolibacter sp.]
MKKVLLVFDGSNFSEAAFRFAAELNERNPILATAVFLPQVDYANLWSYAAVASASSGAPFIPLIEPEDAEEIVNNQKRFEERCRKNGMAYRIHKDYTDFVLPELKKESRFSDLMILDGERFYQGILGDQSLYLKDALHYAECPVVVVADESVFPQSTILAYDGSDDSVYAIKQFAYLFPELVNLPTLLVYASGDPSVELPNESFIEELSSQHFSDLTIQKLDLNPQKHFGTWISEKKGAMLVSGSYSRSGISQLFHKSFVQEVVKTHQLPVFIAHK